MMLDELMLYVEDPYRVAEFWKKNFGFIENITKEEGILKIELRPHASAETKLILFERAVIAKLQPELNLNTPSMLFGVSKGELEPLFEMIQANGVKVGQLVTTPGGMRVFNFADPEGNYFAVRELGDR
ncbi:VOC family protein [Listeria costaricensis]|uniref:VOC family protein n=1 Tax=Listeria costaricensis TaxID=2026604 RepID=UPI000C086A27|nr:VOC family protein [Listeria costaricensis]